MPLCLCGKLANVIEVRVEKLVYGGEGLARLEGRAVLVPLVLPGERVAAHPVKEEPRLIRARLGKVLEPAPERIAPHCPYFARCGGCHYQHAGYQDQLRYKAAILRETLTRIGKLVAPEPELLPSPPWNYRNRAQFKMEKRGDRFRLGYYELGSHRLLAVEACPISSPRINEILPQLWVLGKRPDFPQGAGQIELFVDHNDSVALATASVEAAWPETLVSAARERIPNLASLAVVGADVAGATARPRGPHPGSPGRPYTASRMTRIYGCGNLIYRAGGLDFRVSHGSFFQTNRFLAETLAGAATEGLAGDTALDLFSGVGFFAVHLARAFRRVVAVESDAAGIRDLESNRHRAGATQVEPVHATAQEFLEKAVSSAKARPDVVLLDPPRSGLGRDAADNLAALGAPRIVYVSCDPSTLARDLARLVGRGYRLARLKLVDLFPQTFHIETIATLRLEA